MEEYKKRSHVLIKTWGHCFFCLEKISPKISSPESNPHSGDNAAKSDSFQPVPAFYPTYSLRYLSHYLKLNWKKLLRDDNRDKQLESKASGPKAVLCEGCALLNGRFSELYQQLEWIQMQVLSSLNNINGQLTKAGVERKSLDAVLSSKEMEILAAVRKETIQKCLHKLDCNQPKVRVKRLTILDEKQKENAKLAKAINLCLSKSNNMPRPHPNPLNAALVTASPSPASKSVSDGPPTFGETSRAEPEVIKNTKLQITKRRMEGETSQSKISMSDTETGGFVCKTCEESFTCECSLLRHRKLVHRRKERPSQSKFHKKECREKAKTNARRHRHHHNWSVQTGSKPKCGWCGNRFTNKHTLKTHQKKSCPSRKKWRGNLRSTVIKKEAQVDLNTAETEGEEQIDTSLDAPVQNRVLSPASIPMQSRITSFASIEEFISFPSGGTQASSSFQLTMRNEAFTSSAVKSPEFGTALQNPRNLPTSLPTISMMTPHQIERIEKTLASTSRSPVKPKPIEAVYGETTSCTINRCSFPRKFEGKAVWIGCSWIHKESRQPCKFWVHAKCFGYPDATLDDVDNMPAFYCPTHILLK